MVQPRASRRKVIAISSDEEDEQASEALPSDPSADEEPVKPQKRSTGKLKSVKKQPKSHHSTPPTSTQIGSSRKSPAKPKAAKSKGKTAVKDQPKPAGRTIFSFFNAATQKQQSSQRSASPEKLSTPQDEPEAIHDDSEDEKGSDVHLATGSSTGLALRKRKGQQGGAFENENGLLPASQKFRKANSGDRLPSLSVNNEDKRPWTEQFAPKDLSELAVHKRKVADVRQWFEMALSGRRQRVLVLKGAAGTGKTTTVNLLAQELVLDIMEWKNPAGAELTSEGSLSTSAQFEDFVGRAGRSGGLQFIGGDSEDFHPTLPKQEDKEAFPSERGQLLLIEEFPNTYSRTSSTLQSFRSAISQYLSSPPLAEGISATPIVMVISETLLSTNTALSDSFTAHRLLGPELINHPYLDTIEFNAVAPTILTKALETIVVKEARKSGRRRTPGPQVLKHLVDSGDVRSAISSLEFLCLRGDDENTWSSKVTFSKQKKPKTEAPLTKSEEEALKLISNRESTLGIFHAVGKVVYNKRIDSPLISHPPPWLPQHRRAKVPENDVDELIDELGTDVSTFIAALHENYVLSCGGSSGEEALDSLLGCVNNMSDADLLSVDRFSYGTRAFSGSATDSLRQDEMAFQVAVLGTMFNLPHPVHRSLPADGKRGDAHRMFYPSSLKLWRKKEEIEGVLDLVTSKFQAGGLTDTVIDKSTGSGKGVESWKKTNNSLDTERADEQSSDIPPDINNSAKMEMLIERLPYMSKIAGSKRGKSSFADQIATVTRVRDSAPINEDDEADAEEEGDPSVEQWATDQPDAEGSSKTPYKRRQQKRKTDSTEGAGLGIPMESQVEKLVLEDDDIVDD